MNILPSLLHSLRQRLEQLPDKRRGLNVTYCILCVLHAGAIVPVASTPATSGLDWALDYHCLLAQAVASCAFPVRQAGILPTTSLRPYLATTSLLLGKRFPSPAPTGDFHFQVIEPDTTPVKRCSRTTHHAWRTTEKPAAGGIRRLLKL